MGANEIRDHPWFAEIDFDKLLKLEITPPYLPSVKDKGDVSNIDQLFTKEPPTQTPT